jgi:hypothetical protein
VVTVTPGWRLFLLVCLVLVILFSENYREVVSWWRERGKK